MSPRSSKSCVSRSIAMRSSFPTSSYWTSDSVRTPWKLSGGSRVSSLFSRARATASASASSSGTRLRLSSWTERDARRMDFRRVRQKAESRGAGARVSSPPKTDRVRRTAPRWWLGRRTRAGTCLTPGRSPSRADDLRIARDFRRWWSRYWRTSGFRLSDLPASWSLRNSRLDRQEVLTKSLMVPSVTRVPFK